MIVTKGRLYNKQIDIIMAFLYSFWNKNIWINKLKSYLIDVILVCYLQKALSNLKYTLCV